MISLFFNACQKDIKNGSCKWSPCSNDSQEISTVISTSSNGNVHLFDSLLCKFIVHPPITLETYCWTSCSPLSQFSRVPIADEIALRSLLSAASIVHLIVNLCQSIGSAALTNNVKRAGVCAEEMFQNWTVDTPLLGNTMDSLDLGNAEMQKNKTKPLPQI